MDDHKMIRHQLSATTIAAGIATLFGYKPRIRCSHISKYTPHQGAQECARRRKQKCVS